MAEANAPSLSANATSISADDLMAEIEEALGESVDEMSDKDLAVAGVVTSKLGKSGIQAATTLSKQITAKMVKNGNKYLFNQYKQGGAAEYVSLKTISNATSYRYFYDDSKSTATMTSGTKILIFKRGSNMMYKQNTNSEPESIKSKVLYQGDLYLSEDDARTYFNCDTEYLSGTSYAVCMSSQMQTAAEDAVEAVIDSIN